MAKYYGVERSDEYLAHYGVLGMKWGVRRAKEKGDARKLSRQYQKASRKLAKLSVNANRDLMRKRYQQAKTNMATGAVASAGLSAGVTAAMNRHLSPKERLKIAALAGAGGALGGALVNSEGIMSGRHVSDRGHQRAIAKRNEWNRKMNEAFRGTKYGGKEQRRLQNQIMSISDAKNPKAYAHKQLQRAETEAQRVKPKKTRAIAATNNPQLGDAMKQWADSFDKHYNEAQSRGMSHEQAERYSNDYIAKNGFGSTPRRRRRK